MTTVRNGRLARVALASAISLPLHWLWEMAQMGAYLEMQGMPLAKAAVRCFVASLGDIVVTAVLVGVAVFWRREATPTSRMLAVAVLGLLAAAGIEAWAMAVGRWSYNHNMPLLLGLGLWPLLQMPALSVLSLVLARRVHAK